MNEKGDDWQKLNKLSWAIAHQLTEATFKVKDNDTVSTENKHSPFCQAGLWRVWMFSLHLSGSLENWQSWSVNFTEFQDHILKGGTSVQVPGKTCIQRFNSSPQKANIKKMVILNGLGFFMLSLSCLLKSFLPYVTFVKYFNTLLF